MEYEERDNKIVDCKRKRQMVQLVADCIWSDIAFARLATSTNFWCKYSAETNIRYEINWTKLIKNIDKISFHEFLKVGN